MRWYFPSWNGDVRIEPVDGDPEQCFIVVIEPTPAELRALAKLKEAFGKKTWLKKSWLSHDQDFWVPRNYREGVAQKTLIQAPLAKVAPLVVKLLKTGKQTLSAVVLKDGKVETVQGDDMKTLEPLAAKAETGGKAAATVKRPTPSCPNCFVDACAPATEVLLDFLSNAQHEDWKRHRAIVVEGGITGNRYLLSHRSGPHAARQGRICYDMDSQCVVHFHDQRVPPEEEVLAAKLILEHAEPWLRNEATMLGYRGGDVFKNPFGDAGDGIWDSSLTHRMGGIFAGAAEMLTGKNPLHG
jgi:hypothetical protein